MNIKNLIIDETKVKDVYQQNEVMLGKPHDYMRVHPPKEYRIFPVGLREYDGQTYLILNTVAEQLRRDQFYLAGLVCIYHQNKFMLWSIPLGWRHADQTTHMERMTSAAIASWVRVTDTGQMVPSQSSQYNKTVGARMAVNDDKPSPDWTRCPSMEDMIGSVFRNKIIDTVNHYSLQG
jgi:hypothetical protein